MPIMELGICSFSFHRLLAAGQQDIFRYIQDCKELGCTHAEIAQSLGAPSAEAVRKRVARALVRLEELMRPRNR